MAKVKTQKTDAQVATTVNAEQEDLNTNGARPETVGQMIDIDQLEPSPTNPRKRFPENSIAELAVSIREQGVIEPLIVRYNYQNTADDRRVPFEIVCGERRYRASLAAGLAKLPCIVRELTDEQVLDIQIHENLHREDVHPMDEAYGYKFLQDTFGYNLKELSLRIGKPEAYIANRLKLNLLIDEIQADIGAGVVPISYALEIAKFSDPQTQQQIYYKCFETKWDPGVGESVLDKAMIRPFRNVLGYINDHILFQLSKAPFDRKAENLRSDSLACVKCPDRTGANAGLFDAYEIGKKDSCLNPVCYHAKRSKHIELVRARVAADECVEAGEVPLVSDRWGGSRPGELTRYEYTPVADTEAGKAGVIRAVSVGSDNYGKVVHIRMNEQPSGGSSNASRAVTSDEDREAALIAKRERREELFDIHVGEAVRKRVFRMAAEKFAGTAEIGSDIQADLPRILAFMCVTANNGTQGATKGKIVEALLAEAMGVPQSSLSFSYEIDRAESTAVKLSLANQLRMLFLFTHGDKGAMYYDRYASQEAVRNLADDYNIDYELLDAEARVEFAAAKAKPMFEKYLAEVKAGVTDRKIPRQFAATYKPRT